MSRDLEIRLKVFWHWASNAPRSRTAARIWTFFPRSLSTCGPRCHSRSRPRSATAAGFRTPVGPDGAHQTAPCSSAVRRHGCWPTAYAIERRLGRGGMGTVYAARDTQLNRTVAIKLLRERVQSASALERCRREAQAAAAFAHPNVVTIHDMRLTADGRPFLVMELLTGRTLRQALSDGPLTSPQIRHVFEGVCAALETAHAGTLVHRDLKPENVFLTSGAADACGVKLLDFGISTFVNSDETTSRSGALQGTPEYASPEQIRGEVPNASWDIWALGVMAFESVVGVRPVACVSVALSADARTVDGRWSEPALQRLTPALCRLFRPGAGGGCGGAAQNAGGLSARPGAWNELSGWVCHDPMDAGSTRGGSLASGCRRSARVSLHHLLATGLRVPAPERVERLGCG